MTRATTAAVTARAAAVAVRHSATPLAPEAAAALTERDDAAPAAWIDMLAPGRCCADDEAATRALLGSKRAARGRPAAAGRPEWLVQPGMTSLHLAMAYACPAIVAALLDRGADSRAVSANGCCQASLAGSMEMRAEVENVRSGARALSQDPARVDIGAVALDGAFDFGPEVATARDQRNHADVIRCRRLALHAAVRGGQ